MPHNKDTPIDPSDEQVERAVMVCPQCEGEGGYADGLDEAACHEDCPRCATNGWIVDVAALIALRSPVPRELREALEPFARVADQIDAGQSAPDAILSTSVADFRRAKRAYDHLIQKERSQ